MTVIASVPLSAKDRERFLLTIYHYATSSKAKRIHSRRTTNTGAEPMFSPTRKIAMPSDREPKERDMNEAKFDWAKANQYAQNFAIGLLMDAADEQEKPRRMTKQEQERAYALRAAIMLLSRETRR